MVELISWLMDSLVSSDFILYAADAKGPITTNICYADDTILFSSCDFVSLELMMGKPVAYEQVLGQLVSKRKSNLCATFHEEDPRINDIRRITGFSPCQFPMQYLGCPFI